MATLKLTATHGSSPHADWQADPSVATVCRDQRQFGQKQKGRVTGSIPLSPSRADR